MRYGKYKSRRNKKRALSLKQYGHEGSTEFTPMPNLGIVERLKSAFGSSKHRKARMQRFKARQR